MKYYSQIPPGIADDLVLGGEMTGGLEKDAAELKIVQITAALMEAKTDALADADKAFNTSRSLQEIAYGVFHAADAALTSWLGKVTGVLSAFFGKRWSRQWVQVGFVSSSIQIPDSITERLALALRMIGFLTANPSYEAPNQGVTAAAGQTLRDSLVTTQTSATNADADVATKLAARTTALDALTSYMRMLIGLLSEILSVDDPRWLDFGLYPPAARATPAAPAGLTAATQSVTQARTATAGKAAGAATRTVLLQCEPTPFATRYRFRMLIVGLETEYTLVASSKEPMTMVEVPLEATVQFIVQAVNGNNQGVASDPVILPPPVDAKSAAAEATAETMKLAPAAPATPKAKAHRNGNGAVHRHG